MSESTPPELAWSARLATWLALAAGASLIVSFLELQVEAARGPAATSTLLGAVFAWGQLAVLPLILGGLVAPALAALDRRQVVERLPSLEAVLAAGVLALVVGGAHVLGERLLLPGRLEFTGEIRALVFGVVVGVALASCLAMGWMRARCEALLGRVPRVRRLLVPLLLATSAVVSLVTLHLLLGVMKQRGVAVVGELLVVLLAMLAGRAVVVQIAWRWAGALAGVVLAWVGVAYLAPGTARAHALLVTQHSLARYATNLALREPLDWDGDGSLAPWIGGPDCQEGDPGRGPAVREIPGDGIDQDCRGGDAPVRSALSGVLLPPDCRPPPSPHVLILLIDALRADHVTPEIAPNLTELGRRSLRFERAYAPTAHTNTSVPAFLAARPLADLVGNVVTSDEFVADRTLPEAFAQAGYRTGVFYQLDFNPFSLRGFQDRNPYLSDVSVPNVKFDLTTTSMLDGVMEWFRRASGPKFAYAHLSDVHAPYLLDRDPDGTRRSEAEAYRAGVSYVDARLGNFLARFQSEGLLGRTLIVVTADHGEALMQRGTHGHGPDVYEESIRVPLVMWVPGCRPQRVTRPVVTTRTGPLLGALAGVPVAGHGPFDADDLPAVSEGAVASTAFLLRAVVLGDRKLVVDVPSGGRMLFDLVHDPGETRNVYGSDPAARDELEAAYQRWLDAPGSR